MAVEEAVNALSELEGELCACCLQSVEAARECGMRAVVVAGRKPLYELGAADLVVRGLDELSFINLKQLFSDEESVEAQVRTDSAALTSNPASLCRKASHSLFCRMLTRSESLGVGCRLVCSCLNKSLVDADVISNLMYCVMSTICTSLGRGSCPD